MKCEEIMIHDIARCVTKDTVETRAAMMKAQHVGVLPVCSSSRKGNLVGIITDHDIVVQTLAPCGMQPRRRSGLL